jgi:hypothetical protein
VRLPAPATGLRALSGRLTTASPVFVHLQPPLGPTVPDQCRLSIDPSFAQYHEGKSTMDQAYPCRRCATRQLTYLHPSGWFQHPQITLARDYPSSPPYHWFAPNGPTSPLRSIPATLPSRGSHPDRSVTRHLSRSAQMAFCILTGTPSGFPNGPNSLRSSIQTSDQPCDQPDAYSTCLTRLPAGSTVFWDIVTPPYVKSTLLR